MGQKIGQQNGREIGRKVCQKNGQRKFAEKLDLDRRVLRLTRTRCACVAIAMEHADCRRMCKAFAQEVKDSGGRLLTLSHYRSYDETKMFSKQVNAPESVVPLSAADMSAKDKFSIVTTGPMLALSSETGPTKMLQTLRRYSMLVKVGGVYKTIFLRPLGCKRSHTRLGIAITARFRTQRWI